MNIQVPVDFDPAVQQLITAGRFRDAGEVVAVPCWAPLGTIAAACHPVYALDRRNLRWRIFV